MKSALYPLITSDRPGLLRILLWPVGALLKRAYAAVVSLRDILYTRGIFQTRRLPCPVISVGNIVVGGTGKTPAVIAIAKQLQTDGVRVAVLLRGYKRHSSRPGGALFKRAKNVTIVSDGERCRCSLAESGDEAAMMARLLPGIPILVGRHRYAAGQLAMARFKSEVLLLDDGFQHRQLHRDVDIVTVDATRPFGTGQLLPAGTLREPLTALHRADIILLTRTDFALPGRGAKPVNVKTGRALLPEEERQAVLSDIKEKLGRLAPNTPIMESVHRPMQLYRLRAARDSEQLSLSWLSGKRLLAVCGIGNPNAFVTTLTQYTPATVDLLAFPDHHAYTEADCQRIRRKLKQTGAECVVTTQKDEQKLARFAGELPITVLAVALVVTDSDILASLSLYKI